jgi:hypothetical protein
MILLFLISLYFLLLCVRLAVLIEINFVISNWQQLICGPLIQKEYLLGGLFGKVVMLWLLTFIRVHFLPFPVTLHFSPIYGAYKLFLILPSVSFPPYQRLPAASQLISSSFVIFVPWH